MSQLSGFIILALICYIIYLDAESLKKARFDAYSRKIRRSPAFWAWLAFFFFIFVVPLYLLRRFHYFKEKQIPPQETATPQEHVGDVPPIVSVTKILIVWFLSVQVLSIAIYPSFMSLSDMKFNFPQHIIINILGILLFVVFVLILKDPKKSLRDIIYFQMPERNNALTILFSMGAGVAIAVVVAVILTNRSKVPPTPMMNALQTSSPGVVVQFLFLAALIGPFFEEIIHRGFIFDAINKVRGKKAAIVIVSIVFGMMHFDQLSGDWMAIGLIMVLAVLLTLVRSFSGSVIPGIAMHYSYNIALMALPISFLFIVNPSFAKYMFNRSTLSPNQKIQLLEQSIDERHKNWIAYNELAWILAEEDRELVTALDLIETGLSGMPESPVFLDTKAEILFKLKRFDEAIKIESEIVKNFPRMEIFKKRLERFKSGSKTHR
ncbi:hypothetical protein BVX98_06165 [bacterium F11]|nr:hypothetical protein BVX98_06165 [bacterium F11]